MARGDIFLVRPDGPFYAICFDSKKRQWLRRSTKTRTKAAAREVARQWLHDGEMVELGRVDRTADARKTLEAHIGDYVAMKRLSPKQVTATHITNTADHLRELAAAAGWKRLDEITRDTWLRGLERMLELRRERGAEMAADAEKRLAALKSDRMARNARGGREPVRRVVGKLPSVAPSNSTLQHWRAYWKGFIRWAHRNGRVSVDGLASLESWAIVGMERTRRRAMSVDEIERLLSAAGDGPTRWNVSGRDRMMLYLVALSTGFRAGELATRRVMDFVLDAGSPHLRLEARSAKNRKPVEQRLPPEIVPMLRQWLSGRSREGLVWPGLSQSPASRMIRTDLLAAKVARVDADGRKLDFHALRHTFGTQMARGGVPLVEAQRAMRHSSPALTANIYTHVQSGDLEAAASKAIAGLRCANVARDVRSPAVASGPRPQDSSAAPESQPEESPMSYVENTEENGNGLGGIRTHVEPIMSRWLWAAELPARVTPTSARQD